MKISSQEYAKALYDLTKGQNEEEIKNIITSFVRTLNKNRQLFKEEDIIKNFEIIWDQRRNITQVLITSARPLSTQEKEKIKKFVTEKFGIKKLVLTNKVDPLIKGGLIIKVGGNILDASIAGRLQKLRKALKK